MMIQEGPRQASDERASMTRAIAAVRQIDIGPYTSESPAPYPLSTKEPPKMLPEQP